MQSVAVAAAVSSGRTLWRAGVVASEWVEIGLKTVFVGKMEEEEVASAAAAT